MSLSGIVLFIILILVISIMLTVARTHNYAQKTKEKVDQILELMKQRKE